MPLTGGRRAGARPRGGERGLTGRRTRPKRRRSGCDVWPRPGWRGRPLQPGEIPSAPRLAAHSTVSRTFRGPRQRLDLRAQPPTRDRRPDPRERSSL